MEDTKTSDKIIQAEVDKEIPVCRRCGRKLKSVESRERGMGFTCWKKYNLGPKKLFTIKKE